MVVATERIQHLCSLHLAATDLRAFAMCDYCSWLVVIHWPFDDDVLRLDFVALAASVDGIADADAGAVPPPLMIQHLLAPAGPNSCDVMLVLD